MPSIAPCAETPPDALPSSAAPAPGALMKSLTANFSWNLAGVLIYGFCQWGILIVLAQFGDPVMVGQFALALAVTAPPLLLAGMSMRTVIATDHHRHFEFGDYLGLQLLAIAAALAVVAMIAWASGYPVVSQAAILLVALAKSVELGTDLLYGMLQRHDQMKLIGKSMILKGVLSLVSVAAAVYITGSVIGAALGLVISWGLLLVFYDFANVRKLGWETDSKKLQFTPRWNRCQLAALARLALPMGLTVMLGAVIINLPRYFLEEYHGEYPLGIFAALAYFVVAGHLVAGALAQAALPRLSKFYALGELGQFRRLLGKLIAIALCLGCMASLVAWGIGEKIISLLYGPEYAAHVEVFQVLMLSLLGVFPTFVMDYALFAARWFRILTPINAVMVVFLAWASWIWIPNAGMIGAAWVTILGVAIQAVIRIFLIWKLTSTPVHSPNPALNPGGEE